ncbi:MAG: hypothetical protein E6R03_11455 [Hyphomicrobiaceae bacterium]|nr:MAG: hypothetical protein E6R03_11455 [Hyphomicrobiaceae bacterium]
MRYVKTQDGQVVAKPRRRYGLGSMIAAVAGAAGIEKCGDCETREEKLDAATDAMAEKLGLKEKKQ